MDAPISYEEFARCVTTQRRYLLPTECRKFLEYVVSTSRGRHEVYEQGKALYRAQIAHEDIPFIQKGVVIPLPLELVKPASVKRMMPWPDKATEGRVNPKGIPCLYCATEQDTAVGEVRPGNGSFVTVGEFEIASPVTLIDCTKDAPTNPFDAVLQFMNDQQEKSIWAHLNIAFSTPVLKDNENHKAGYATTQVIAEAFKDEHVDGIIYGSQFGTGKNVALFDLKQAVMRRAIVKKITKIDPKFSDASDVFDVDSSGQLVGGSAGQPLSLPIEQ